MASVKKKEVRGIRNNNPLNLKKGSSWKGERPIQTDPKFEEFISMEWGIRAALKLMRNHITGFKNTRPKMNTVKKLISIWAPPSENATNNYLKLVCEKTGYEPTTVIDPDSRTMMVKIARVMAYVECGQWIDEEKFQSAWDLL